MSESQWYALQEAFDSSNEERVPFPGLDAYVEGTLEDLVVIQYPSISPPERVQAFLEHLRTTPLKGRSILVSDDVKFLRLRPATEEESARLDKVPDPK